MGGRKVSFLNKTIKNIPNMKNRICRSPKDCPITSHKYKFLTPKIINF